MVPSALSTASAPPEKYFRGSITRPADSLCTLHALGCPRPRNTRFRLPARLAGRDLHPLGPGKEFLCLTRPLLPGFAWRTESLNFLKQRSNWKIFNALLSVSDTPPDRSFPHPTDPAGPD